MTTINFRKIFNNHLLFGLYISLFTFFYYLSLQIIGVFNLISSLFIVMLPICASSACFLILRRIIIFFPDKNIEVKTQNGINRLFQILIAVILISQFFLALLVTPNNWDSMTYHLPRIEHWISNRNMFFYETSIDRQLWMQNLNSSLMLIPRAIDINNLVNLIQFFCAIAILRIVFLWLKKLEFSKKLNYSIILFIITTPTFVVEMPTTQSDIVAALFIFVNFMFLYEIVTGRPNWFLITGFSTSLALSIAAKGTTYPYVFLSLALFVTLMWLKKYERLKSLLFLTFCIVSTNFILFWQSIKKFGSITGPSNTVTALITEFSPMRIFENLIHFVAYSLQGYSHKLNEEIFSFTKITSQNLGINLVHPSNSWPVWNALQGKFNFTFFPSFGVNEDSSVSIHFLLLAIIAFLVVLKRDLRSKNGLILLALPLLYFVILASILRWNPWLHRYFIGPYLILLVGFAIYKKRVLEKFISMVMILSFASLIYSLPFVFHSNKRSYLGEKSFYKLNPIEQQFIYRENLIDDFYELENKIEKSRPNVLLLDLRSDDWEFPIWKIARKYNLSVKNIKYDSSELKENNIVVCFVSCTRIYPPTTKLQIFS